MTSNDSKTNQRGGLPHRRRFITSVFLFSVLLAIAPISSCRKESPVAKKTDQPQKANVVQDKQARPLSKEEQSCKEFVQEFYDWYVSSEIADECKQANKMHYENTDTLSTCKRASEFHPVKAMSLKQVLSPKLKRLLDNDYAAQAKSDDGIVGMDGDPFLNGNGGVIYNYDVDSVQVKEGKCYAIVNETGINGNYEEEGKIYDRITVDLANANGKWIIDNLQYHRTYNEGSKVFSKDDDLVSWLKRLGDDH